MTMEVHLQSFEDLNNTAESNDLLQEQNSLSLPNEEDVNAEASKTDSRELEKLFDTTEEDHHNHQQNKSLNVREIHETSPFKQAVKGFVLSKLSKKVGSSHILSGLTEKIVKKLEDKDNSQSTSVHNSESDLSLSNLKSKEESLDDIISSSISCELKSVVANDLALSEVTSIEDAVECVEELKSSDDSIDSGLIIPQKNDSKEMIRSNSISLPSSPAHQFIKRASSISYSLDSEESPKKFSHSSNLTFLGEENKDNESDSKCEKSIPIEEIELKDIMHDSSFKRHEDSEVSYPNNIYIDDKEDISNFKSNIWTYFSSILHMLKSSYHCLSLAHFFLLVSVIIHNISIIPFILIIIFDTIIIAYVCYSYICALMQKPMSNKSSNFSLVDPHFENTSIRIQKTKLVKGCVKVLKGEYDPENVKNHSTDLVDISIENSCLKIYTPKKKKDVSTNLQSFTFYDISGATVSILPKDLSRKRIWNKKYPICIIFPSICKKSSSTVSFNDADSPSVDYLSPIHDDNNDIEKKALYFFALTDREKESLFWAILKNAEEYDDASSVQAQKTSLKIDFSSLSYTSLMELNGEDSSSSFKDIDEDDSSIIENVNADLEFENYMKKLFENFERMAKFSSRTRSFGDLSELKEEIPKSSDSFMSKDDFFLSTINKEEYSVDWLNLVLGRLFYDFLTQKCWSDDVKARIQKKLNRIEMPSFIETLEVSDVFLGTSLPQIHSVSNPVINVNGVWLNCDFNYCGSFQMTLKTKLNVIKAKQLPETEAVDAVESKQSIHSAPSSESDEEVDTETKNPSSKKKKFINRIEKWISHKHFQTVAKSRFVKKYVGDLSNMPLTLTVELNNLHGTLILNIPPAPTDRIWYGFQKDPVLLLNASPKVGTHEINLSAVVKMIEKQLIQEFKKALVMPNMDDLLIPIMYSPVYEI